MGHRRVYRPHLSMDESVRLRPLRERVLRC